MATVFHKLEIAEVTRPTDDAISIVFHVPRHLDDRFRFQPGQFLMLKAEVNGKQLRRSYSICSGADDGELRIGIRRAPGGTFSTFAYETFRKGDMVAVMAPNGRFAEGAAAPPDQNGSYLAFAAGSGITPILSLIKTYLARQPSSDFMLVYGNRTTGSIMFKDELESLKDRFVARLAVHHLLSRESQDIPLLDGRIDAEKTRAFLRLFGGPARASMVFLCGPHGMMEEVGQALIEEGVAPDRIRREAFGVGPIQNGRSKARRSDPAEAGRLAIKLDGITHALTVGEDETVLAAALRQGLDLPHSCRAGMCCSCRAKLLDGEVHMIQNFSLQEREMAEGFVLTCQAVPKSRDLSFDFDAV